MCISILYDCVIFYNEYSPWSHEMNWWQSLKFVVLLIPCEINNLVITMCLSIIWLISLISGTLSGVTTCPWPWLWQGCPNALTCSLRWASTPWLWTQKAICHRHSFSTRHLCMDVGVIKIEDTSTEDRTGMDTGLIVITVIVYTVCCDINKLCKIDLKPV